jgi:hypothetical protein
LVCAAARVELAAAVAPSKFRGRYALSFTPNLQLLIERPFLEPVHSLDLHAGKPLSAELAPSPLTRPEALAAAETSA